MATKRGNSRQTLSSDARAWLDGEHKTGSFFMFKMQDELQALWDAEGDDSKMFYRRGQCLPITLDDLEERENAWLGNVDDKYGLEASFIHNHYNEDDKRILWEERGNTDSMYWKPGMFKPLPIGA
jgi:hypothetical protein